MDAHGTIMTSKVIPNIFDTKADLASQLADDVAKRLQDKITANGSASIAVSGGSTPKVFFEKLSQHDIDWDKVFVIMVDERYVPPGDDRSNEKLIRDNLLKGKAASAKLVSFWQEGQNIDQAEATLDSVLKAYPNIDITVLGMGLDGHTASFFPGGNNLEAATKTSCERAIIQMEAEGAGEPRLTLTLPVIVNSSYLVLHIEGDGKRDVLDQALNAELAEAPPIRTVIEALNGSINLYWAP